MQITFLVPDIHALPTGGNLYNRRVIAQLREEATVDVVPWPVEGAPGAAFALPEHAVVVVDSLLLRQAEALRSLRAERSGASLVLLAHYLHSIDPTRRDAAAARTEAELLPLFDGAVTTSRFAKQALQALGVSGPHVAVVPPGLDEAFRAPAPERPQRDSPHLLTVANLLPGKGLLPLVDVLAEVADEAWTWTLVGDASLDPDFARRFRARLDDSPVAERTTLAGAVPEAEMRSVYDRADLFVLPSRFETCSMSAREAMARALPVVAYRVGGLPENFGGRRAGRLVPPGEASAFRAALDALLSEPALRAEMGRAAREASRRFPSWSEAAVQLRTFLSERAAVL